MKKICCFMLILFTGQVSIAQSVKNPSTGYFVEAFDADGKSLTSVKKVNTEGSPYVNDQWQTGRVVFFNGLVADNMLLRFNLNKQELQFRRDTVNYLFSDAVREFMIPVKEKETTRQILFRAGYPDNGRYTPSSYYNVLASGKNFHLVKMIVCRLLDKYDYIGPSGQRYQNVEELYLFNVAEMKFIKIKKDKSALKEKLGTYNDAVKTFLLQNKLETENDLIDFTDQLNK